MLFLAFNQILFFPLLFTTLSLFHVLEVSDNLLRILADYKDSYSKEKSLWETS